jgi:YHS domain-containing protein
MARCKCKICGAGLDTATAYKVIDKNGKNKYFCSQSEFDAEEARKNKAAEDKERVYRLICDIMGEKEIISTALFKEWVVWNKVADNAKIGDYLEENRSYLSSVIGRLSSSEYARIRYLSTIIRDRIKTYQPKPKIEQRERQIEISGVGPVNYKPRETRRGLDFLEDE